MTHPSQSSESEDPLPLYPPSLMTAEECVTAYEREDRWMRMSKGLTNPDAYGPLPTLADRSRDETVHDASSSEGPQQITSLMFLMEQAHQGITGKPSEWIRDNITSGDAIDSALLFKTLSDDEKVLYRSYVVELIDRQAARTTDFQTGEILLDIAEHMTVLQARAKVTGATVMHALVNTEPVAIQETR